MEIPLGNYKIVPLKSCEKKDVVTLEDYSGKRLLMISSIWSAGFEFCLSLRFCCSLVSCSSIPPTLYF